MRISPTICGYRTAKAHIPSGKLTCCYGKSPFWMGKLTISMAIFNSYVKLPEGTLHFQRPPYWGLRISPTICIGWIHLKAELSIDGALSGDLGCCGDQHAGGGVSVSFRRAVGFWMAQRWQFLWHFFWIIWWKNIDDSYMIIHDHLINHLIIDHLLDFVVFAHI